MCICQVLKLGRGSQKSPTKCLKQTLSLGEPLISGLLTAWSTQWCAALVCPAWLKPAAAEFTLVSQLNAHVGSSLRDMYTRYGWCTIGLVVAFARNTLIEHTYFYVKSKLRSWPYDTRVWALWKQLLGKSNYLYIKDIFKSRTFSSSSSSLLSSNLLFISQTLAIESSSIQFMSTMSGIQGQILEVTG